MIDMIDEAIRVLKDNGYTGPIDGIPEILAAIYKVANYYYRQHFDTDIVLVPHRRSPETYEAEWFEVNKFMLVVYAVNNVFKFKLYGITASPEYMHVYNSLYSALEIPNELWSHTVNKNTIYDINTSIVETINNATQEELELYLKLK